jgi:hypothetical protein
VVAGQLLLLLLMLLYLYRAACMLKMILLFAVLCYPCV